MAKPSKPAVSSGDGVSESSSQSGSEEQQINDQIGPEDEEELEAFACSGDDDDNSPDTGEEDGVAAAEEDDDEDEQTHQKNQLKDTIEVEEPEEVGDPLTAEELEEKERLLEDGFSSWSRRDFNTFIRACEKYGRNDIKGIASEMEGKTDEEVDRYAKVFKERYKELNDYDRIINKIERGEARISRKDEIMKAIGKKLNRYKHPWLELKIQYGQNKGKLYNEECDRFMICMVHKLGYGNWDELKAAFRTSPLFHFDWFVKSRTTQELARRCDTLIRLVEKENQEYDERERQARKEKKLVKSMTTPSKRSMPCQASESPSLKKRKQLTMDDYCNTPRMERKWFVLPLLACLILCSDGRELNRFQNHDKVYNHTLTTIMVHYASAVYISDLTELFTWTCTKCNGVTEGFEMIELIVDIQHCLQAFVGVAKDPNAIVIAFRGTQEHSIQNWIEDLYWKQLDISYPGMPDTMVHHGFYNAYHTTTIRTSVLNAVAKAQEFYGDLDVIVTGHSMGGAMASFCGLDLKISNRSQNVQVITFGQPRIGNAAFATYFGKMLPNTIRVTNRRDIVPHLPPYYSFFPQKTYHHFATEVWLYDIGLGILSYGVEKVCDRTGEDPTCSRSVRGTSIVDHLNYFGVELMCKDWQSCRIVMEPPLLEHGKMDIDGNIFLSRNPGTRLIKLNTPKIEVQ